MSKGLRRIVVILGVLGDFDSLEYAQVLVRHRDLINSSNIKIYAIGIGNEISKDRFCKYTKFPKEWLEVEFNPSIHYQLKLFTGINSPFGELTNLLFMCCGINSPGTLCEVLRGYVGDKTSSSLFEPEQTINLPLIGSLDWEIFDKIGSRNCLRPFELATLRLQNMVEVISEWSTYFPENKYLTMRGATYLIDENDNLTYVYKPKSLLSYSATMSKPLAFIDTWIHN